MKARPKEQILSCHRNPAREVGVKRFVQDDLPS